MSTATGSIRVLVLDDDPVFRRILVRTFERIPQATVVAAVSTIKEAQRQLDAGQIDLVTLDVVLQEGSGLDLLPWLRSNHPKVLSVILTAGTERRASQSIDAILLGATSLVLKPSGMTAADQLHTSLKRVVDGLVPPVVATSGQAQVFAASFSASRELVAVGASTGGPAVVLQFLKDLPLSLQVPILVTQHIAVEHMASLANMLCYPGGRSVRLARHGEAVMPANVYLASDGKHLQVMRRDSRLVLQQNNGPEENFCRPAVDPMFRSVAEVCGSASIGVLMTGMGSDGAKGALALRQRGAPVVVQDQPSSVVWGMPGAAVALGAASEVVAGSALGSTVTKLIQPTFTTARGTAP